MTTILPNFELVHVLYVLVNHDATHFALAVSSHQDGRLRQLKMNWVSVEHSFMFRAKNRALVEEVRDALVKGLRGREVTKLKGCKKRFFDAAALDDVSAALVELNHDDTEIFSMRDFVPQLSSEMEGLLSAELDAEARLWKLEQISRDEENARYREERLRESAELARKTRMQWNSRVKELLKNEAVICLSDPETWKAPCNLISELDILVDGRLELLYDKNRNGEYLGFWISDRLFIEAKRIAEKLSQFVVFKQFPGPDVNGDYPLGRDLTEQLCELRFPVGRPGTSQYALSFAKDDIVKRFLQAIKPQVRGWDLPLDSKHLGFDPALTRRFAKSSPDDKVAFPEVQVTWRTAQREPDDTLARLLEGIGLKPGFNAPAIRYCETTPLMPGDAGPFVLYRLTHDNRDVGFQTVSASTGNRQAFFFDIAYPDAHSRIWAPKATTLVAVSAEDAIALNAMTREPVIVTPTPAALSSLQLLEDVKQMVVCLRSDCDEIWLNAALEQRYLCEQAGIDFLCQAPTGNYEGEAHPWRAHQLAGKRLKQSVAIPLTQSKPLLELLS